MSPPPVPFASALSAPGDRTPFFSLQNVPLWVSLALIVVLGVVGIASNHKPAPEPVPAVAGR